MSKAIKLLESLAREIRTSNDPPITERKKKERVFTQYMTSGNIFRPMGHIETSETVSPGIYNIKSDMNGLFFELCEINTDELLKFEDSRYNQVLEEIDKFWKLKENYDDLGFTHKRGVLLHGSPGTGKSCLLKLVMESVVNDNNIVIVCNEASLITEGLRLIRDIEPDRQILVVTEDIDSSMKYQERPLLELLDGNATQGGVLFLATTNYLKNLPARMLRANRFDRLVEIHNPPEDGRKAYFTLKIGDRESTKKIEELVEKTKGFSFAELREFMVSVYCLDAKVGEAVKRIKSPRASIVENETDQVKESDLDDSIVEFYEKDEK